MTDILTDKMTDKELQRLKILEEYFEKNNYIDNSETQKILNILFSFNLSPNFTISFYTFSLFSLQSLPKSHLLQVYSKIFSL